MATENGRSPAITTGFSPGTGLERFVRAASVRKQLREPGVVANYVLEYLFPAEDHPFEQEELWVLLIDRKNVVSHEVLVYRGTIESCAVRMAEIFREAVRFGAAGIVVAHCHPSGDPTPSPEDLAITRNIVQTGKILDVDVLDHVIIGHQRWVSLRERGVIDLI